MLLRPPSPALPGRLLKQAESLCTSARMLQQEEGGLVHPPPVVPLPTLSLDPLHKCMHVAGGSRKWMGCVWPDRLVFVEVSLLEVAEFGLQVLEVLRDALVLLSQPHVGLRILLLMLGIPLLHINRQCLLLSWATLHTACGAGSRGAEDQRFWLLCWVHREGWGSMGRGNVEWQGDHETGEQAPMCFLPCEEHGSAQFSARGMGVSTTCSSATAAAAECPTNPTQAGC